MTDKDGKKLQVGSVVALKKAGATNFTIKGRVISVQETNITLCADRNQAIYYATSPEIKRISYKPAPKRKYEYTS